MSGSMKEAFEDLLGDRLSVGEAVERHFDPSFRQRVDGTWIDRRAFAAGIAGLRKAVERAEITILDELGEGDLYADRHVVELAMRDGGRVRQEVYVFGERAGDGRFLRLEEATLALEAGPEIEGT